MQVWTWGEKNFPHSRVVPGQGLPLLEKASEAWVQLGVQLVPSKGFLSLQALLRGTTSFRTSLQTITVGIASKAWDSGASVLNPLSFESPLGQP